MSGTCVICPQLRSAATARLPQWPPVCDGCREQVRRELAELPDLYAQIPAELELGSSNGQKVSGTKHPPLPLRLDALNLLVGVPGTEVIHDPYRDQVGPVPPVVVLDLWVRDWISTRDRSERLPVPTVASLSGWLLNRLEWALDHHPAVDEFAAELHNTLRAIRTTIQAHRTGQPVGRCPSRLADDTRCDTKLYADPYVEQIACGRCGASWTRLNQGWVRFRAAQLAWEQAA